MESLPATLERWFDRRFASAALGEASRREWRAGALDAERTAVHRVPLPAVPAFTIRFTGEEETRVRRSLLGFVGLGERMYLVDSAPTGMLERPLGLVVYRAFSTRPVAALWGSRLPLLQGRPLPLFDRAWLSAQVVHNPGAIPPAEAPGGVQFSLPPMVGPFPRRRAPIPPAGGFGPPSGNGPLVAGACPPVNAFFCLCLQNPLAPPGEKERDGMSDRGRAVDGAFGNRGFRTRTYVAGENGLQTFDQMVASFRRDLAAVPGLCQCPEDKVVIFLIAHGTPGSLQWQVQAGDAPTVSFDAFAEALSATPEIAANPQKFVLLVTSCHSGQFFQNPLPGALAGIGLVTSTSDDTTVSYGGGLDRWVTDALGDAGVRTWEDFAARVMWGWRNANGTHHGRPRTGWIEGCRATATVRSIESSGTDLGSAWTLVHHTQTPPTTGRATLPHGATTAVTTILSDRLTRPCDATPLDTYVSLQAEIDFGGARVTGFQGKTVSQACEPGARTTYDFVVPVSAGSGREALLKVVFELHTRCAP